MPREFPTTPTHRQKSPFDAGGPVYNIVYMSATVRIEARAHAALSAIARAKQLSLTEALSRAIEAYRREVFVADLSSDFAALREAVAAAYPRTRVNLDWI